MKWIYLHTQTTFTSVQKVRCLVTSAKSGSLVLLQSVHDVAAVLTVYHSIHREVLIPINDLGGGQYNFV